MATSNANLERRIERNTNDIEAIYDMLTDHGVRLTEIEGRLASHSRDLATIRKKLGDHDRRFDSHDARFDSHDARFDAIDATLAEVLRRLPEQPAS